MNMENKNGKRVLRVELNTRLSLPFSIFLSYFIFKFISSPDACLLYPSQR